MASFTKNNQKKMVTTITKTINEEKNVDNKSACFVNTDTSGSVQGAPLVEATKGTIELKKMIAEGNNGAHMEVRTFANYVNIAMKRRPCYAINDQILKEAILSSPSGGTALWDAVINTVHAIQRETAQGKLRRNMRKVVITFTDGMDNASSNGSFRRVCELLDHPGVPNVNFYFLAVGSADVATMHVLARGKKHVHVIDECGGAEVSAECD